MSEYGVGSQLLPWNFVGRRGEGRIAGERGGGGAGMGREI